MVISIQVFACRTRLCFSRPLVHKVRHSSSFPSVESITETPGAVAEKAKLSGAADRRTRNGEMDTPEWKKLSSKELGIKTSMISKPTRLVLNGLKKEGYQVYLVGGCVRDLILQRTPKDFDIITSAELKEVLRTFQRCEVVGKRFPICHVHVHDTYVEVSSFSTFGRKSGRSSRRPLRKPPGCREDDFIRWRNCLNRDFTINGLMFDPFTKIIYDYTGGMEDIMKAKVRTVIPATTSFLEDCARILRGVRIAARLGFRFTKETARSIRELSSSILRLEKGRILMEMNYMLAYGSAEASLRLLWKFGLLEILLPVQAAYFVSQGFQRRDTRSNMLLSLFSSLDRYLAPDQPCHCSLWVGLLVFHTALADHPRDPLVVAAFSIALHSGGSLLEAVKIAKKVRQPHNAGFTELIKPGSFTSDDTLINEVADLASAVHDALYKLKDEQFVSQAMIEYPQAPQSDLVFITMALSMKVSMIFQCVSRGKERGFIPKRGSQIDYDSLALGRLHEVRHVLARVIFDTVYPLKSEKNNHSNRTSS